MKHKQPTAIAEETIEAMRVRLAPLGFAPAEIPWEELYKLRRYWLQRTLAWRVEQISIHYLTSYTSELTLTRNICVPYRDRPVDQCCLDGQSFGNVRFPSLTVHSLLPSRFANRVHRHILKGLTWFDGYATPQMCLNRLASGEANGINPEGPLGVAMAEHLTALVESGVGEL